MTSLPAFFFLRLYPPHLITFCQIALHVVPFVFISKHVSICLILHGIGEDSSVLAMNNERKNGKEAANWSCFSLISMLAFLQWPRCNMLMFWCLLRHAPRALLGQLLDWLFELTFVNNKTPNVTQHVLMCLIINLSLTYYVKDNAVNKLQN